MEQANLSLYAGIMDVVLYVAQAVGQRYLEFIFEFFPRFPPVKNS